MAAFMVGYGIFEMPWGFLGDRSGREKHLGRHHPGRLDPDRLPGAGWLAAARGGRGRSRCSSVLRFLFGAFQAGTFPAISRMMADWMPTTERGTAQGAIWMSSRLGGALAPLLLVWLFADDGRLEDAAGARGGAWAWSGAHSSGPGFATARRRCRRSIESERKLILAGRSVRGRARAWLGSLGEDDAARRASGRYA